MKRLIVFLTVQAILTFCPVAMALILNDGLSHTINTYYHSDLELDPDNDIIPGTHINLIDGGEFIGSIDVNHHATININGGTVNYGGIHAYGDSIVTITDGLVKGYSSAASNSTVNILGGDTNHFTLHSNANLFMSGGSLGAVRSFNNSTVTVFDGSIGGYLDVGDSGIINLYGTGFEVNGQALSYGDKLSDFVPLTEYTSDEVINIWRTGTITGTLAGGSTLNSTFHIYYSDTLVDTADIFVVPEPATIALFGLGGLLLRKQK